MAYVGSTNPMASSTGRGTYTIGGSSNGVTAVSTQGTGTNTFLTLVSDSDTASLIGKGAFQVPASMLTVAAPSAAQQQAAIQAATQITTDANNSRMMTAMLGQALGALGPALASMFSGIGGGAGGSRAKASSLASADAAGGGGCANGQCGNKAAQREVAWNDKGAGSCADGQCGNNNG
jgi:hypothetical protein